MPEAYIHGYSSEEQARLTLMQSLINQRQLAAMDLRGVRRVLDVGSGLGQMTRAIAKRLSPASTVIGVEQSAVQLAEAHRQADLERDAHLVEFRQGDALDLPLAASELGSFDLVHARFLLEHVSNPLEVVRQMARAARVGGRVVLVDDDHDLLRLWPECKPFHRAWEIYWQSYRELGFDPLIGRKLGDLLHQAGVAQIEIDTIFYGAHADSEWFAPVVDNLIGVVRSAAEMLNERRLLSNEQMTYALSAIAQWRQSPVACLWYSLPMAIGTKTHSGPNAI